MEWRILSAEQLSALYITDMPRDFPPAERRPEADTLALYHAGVYHGWGVFDTEKEPDPASNCNDALSSLCAYLLVSCPIAQGPVLLDYFAVRPAFRARGLGAQLLAELARREGRPLLIESEWPERAPDAAMAIRRLDFYRRCGAVLTPWCDRSFAAWFRVLLLEGGTAPDAARLEAAGAQLSAIYRKMFAGDMYERLFELCRPE